MFGKVLETPDGPQYHPPQQRQRRVPTSDERLRRIAEMSSGLVLAAGYIADVVQAVLYPPVFPRQCQQLRWSDMLGGEGGDCEQRLDGLRSA